VLEGENEYKDQRVLMLERVIDLVLNSDDMEVVLNCE